MKFGLVLFLCSFVAEECLPPHYFPAQFDDELVLITKLVKKPSYTIEFDYKILKNDNVITLGYTKLIFIKSINSKPIRCPQPIIESINFLE